MVYIVSGMVAKFFFHSIPVCSLFFQEEEVKKKKKFLLVGGAFCVH